MIWLKVLFFSERLIVYGNRFRSEYPEIDRMLDESIELFNKGQYKKSLDLLISELKKVDNNLLERLEIEI